jgi:hypothetical protein
MKFVIFNFSVEGDDMPNEPGGAPGVSSLGTHSHFDTDSVSREQISPQSSPDSEWNPPDGHSSSQILPDSNRAEFPLPWYAITPRIMSQSLKCDNDDSGLQCDELIGESTEISGLRVTDSLASRPFIPNLRGPFYSRTILIAELRGTLRRTLEVTLESTCQKLLDPSATDSLASRPFAPNLRGLFHSRTNPMTELRDTLRRTPEGTLESWKERHPQFSSIFSESMRRWDRGIWWWW